ncbi:hypothetical protein DYB32_007688 [Aphanomyces invadans]|uniref:DDE Tnp4 domain-containing protein n=1 Tax=Aphanomyces invadans TaxID=157072 RepID=A0A3R6Z056_9STRA|nr:hypothetical protein DYB32_007688 [Aphanomyces invadans]
MQNQRQEKRARYSTARHDDDGDQDESTSPIYDAHLDSQGPDGIHILTNFSPSEFTLLWAEVRNHIARHWNVGSGRKSDVSARDMLFIVLTSLKHCGTWDIVAAVFQQTVTFEKRVMTYLDVLDAFLYRKFVEAAAKTWTVTRLASMNQRFVNFPHARYATDVTFQQTNIPSGSYAEKKLFFSGKHHLYGHKVEMSVLPNGLAIDCSAFAKGSVSDKAIFDGNVEFHRITLAKKGSESSMADAGQEEKAIAQWAALVEKGYQGIQHQVRGIIPSKKPAHGSLTSEQPRKYRIASDRAIVENFFGHLKTLWDVCSDTYSWNRKNYDMLVQTCVALTNVHVRFHPLRSEDGDVYAQYANRMNSIRARSMKGKRNSERVYLSKRNARLALALASETALTGNDGASDTEVSSHDEM